MAPHGHGGDDEEEVVVVRTDGPPFIDIKAKQGKGFECDYDNIQKYLGPGKVSRAEFTRDLAAINATYIPTAHRSGIYLKAATNMLLGAFVVFILMGILGEFAGSARTTVNSLCSVVFVLGMLAFGFSKWIEQPGIRLGADAVKRLLDGKINPAYAGNPFKIRYAIAVRVQKRKAMHAGREFCDRPVITIWALRSEDSAGQVVDWPVPESLLNSVYIDDGSDLNVVGADKLQQQQQKH